MHAGSVRSVPGRRSRRPRRAAAAVLPQPLRRRRRRQQHLFPRRPPMVATHRKRLGGVGGRRPTWPLPRRRCTPRRLRKSRSRPPLQLRWKRPRRSVRATRRGGRRSELRHGSRSASRRQPIHHPRRRGRRRPVPPPSQPSSVRQRQPLRRSERRRQCVRRSRRHHPSSRGSSGRSGPARSFPDLRGRSPYRLVGTCHRRVRSRPRPPVRRRPCQVVVTTSGAVRPRLVASARKGSAGRSIRKQ